MDGILSSLGGLSIRADVVISPERSLARQMSVMHGIESGGSGSGDLSGSCMRPASNSNNILAGLVVSAQMNHPTMPTSASPFYVCGKAGKQSFEVPLKTLFIKALESVGIKNPVFIDGGFRGSFQVHIEFKPGLALSNLAGSDKIKIVGDVCATHELAEASAIKKAFVHLAIMDKVAVVDISSRKESSLLRTCRELYRNVTYGLETVQVMLEKWHSCLDNLFLVEKFAFLKLKYGNPVVASLAQPIYNSMLFIKRTTTGHICSFEDKMKELSAEKVKYAEATRSKTQLLSKDSMKKAYFHEVDTLALFMQWLNLEPCQYAATMGDDGLYMGAVMLSFPFEQTVVPPGDMCIEARYPKKTKAKAYNSAAMEAILYLEQQFNVEVVGYNHNNKLSAERDMFLLKSLNEQINWLGANVMKFWEAMLTEFDRSIHANKHSGPFIAKSDEDGMAFFYDVIGRLELAASKCNASFKQAADKFASLK